MTNKGFVGYPGGGSSGSVTPDKLSVPQGWGILYTGRYYYTVAASAITTSAGLNNAALRVSPWFVPNQCTVSRLGAEVTTTGDSGSKLRLGIYADDGTGYPGTLILDAGTIAGDSATVQEITISQGLAAGLYWMASAVQVVTTTQPTVRVANAASGPIGIFNVHIGTSTPSAGSNSMGFTASSAATGALPNTYPSGATSTGTIARTFVKIA